MRRALIGRWLLASLVGLVACSSDEAEPATQMIITVDAEPGVRARADGLRILVQSSASSDLTALEERTTLDLTPDAGDPPYPIRVAFAPAAGHESWTFVVTATATDGDDDVAFARIVTSYVSGHTKYVRLVIEDACMVTLTCEIDETCHEGECDDARVDPNTLPDQPITPVLPDGGPTELCTTNQDCALSVMCATSSVCNPQDPDADESGCVAGTPITCDDDVACTFDACVETVGCVFTPPDADDDGHPDAACVDADGEPLGDDCADDDGARFPGALEVCDETGVDEDCDPSTIGFKDNDGDGAIDAMCCNEGSQGEPVCGFDCNDEDLAIHAKQPEFCDGIDNDCDNRMDEVENAVAWYLDEDMDGFGTGAPVITSCTPQPGRSLLNNDCNDDDAEVSPGATEECDNADNNCNEVSDERLIACATSPDPEEPLPINECVNGLSDCSEIAACSDVKDGFACACPSGYAGTGRGTEGCSDENECLTNNGGCDTDPMAECVDEVLAPRTCDCPSGFNGTGIGVDGCIDGNPCLVNNGGCDREPMATCTWRDGEDPACACPSGYGASSLDPTQCVDINECDTNNGDCGPSEFYRCQNNDGRAPTCTELDRCMIMNGGCDQTPLAVCDQDGQTITCDCPNGYNGDGVGSTGCADINECTANTDNCDSSPEACVNAMGTFSCVCPSGYDGNGVGTGGCDDINECSTNNGGCSTTPMVVCTNTMGSRTCAACPSGYTGNGMTCTDVNECSTNNGGCSETPLVMCTNTPGSRTCGACPVGYTGNGMTCADINECLTNNGGCSTSPMVTCTNIPGGRTCGGCPAGYMDSGGTCVDINECNTNNGGCSETPMVTCTNTAGSRTCGACPGGYTGNGVTCTDVNECLTGNGGCSTSPMVSCTNTGGSRTCGACPTGYMTSNGGVTCTDVNECTTNTDNCASIATCTNATPGFTCMCPSGYSTSNGGVTCTDINECATNNGNCGPAAGARCINNDGAAPTCLDINPCTTNNGGCGSATMWRCVDDHPFGLPSCIDITPIGYYDDLGGSATWTAGYLGGISVTVSATTTISRLGVIGGIAGGGGIVSMGVYTNVGGAPGNLMARSEDNFVNTTGRNELTAEAAPGGSLTLPAGTYWIMGLVSVNGVIHQGGSNVNRRIVAWGGTSLPTTAPATTLQPAPPINFYMVP